MVARDDLIDALNNCIDRLNGGETLNDVLADYPALADQLRPMLEAGLLYPRARIPAVEVEAARNAAEPGIRQAVQQTFSGGFPWTTLLLVALMIGGGSILALILNDDNPIVIPPATDTPIITETATGTPTATPSPTETATGTPTATPSPTETATGTPTATPSPTPEAARRLIIEGPISAIDDGELRIYDFILALQPDDPLRSVLQVGDVVRVEAERDQDEAPIRVINLTVLNVIIIVGDGVAWRGDDCNNPPPTWAQDRAGDWYARCATAVPQAPQIPQITQVPQVPQDPPPSSGGGSPEDDNDDDDDDDNDDDD